MDELRDEQAIETWNATARVGLDREGDVMIIDSQDYSIILSPRGAHDLMIWLQRYVPFFGVEK